jgi:acyl-CoA reductase-like NAD-dependent aldehyde dehydrogenase
MFKQLIEEQRKHFATGKTKSLDYRVEQLKKLRQAILERENSIVMALNQDLRKPELDSYITEIRVSIQEIDYALKHLKKWAKPRRVKTSLETFPSVAQIYPDPLGIVLIISPWNYPFALAISPLIGAIAAGNCAVIKPSESTPTVSQVIAEIIQQTFSTTEIAVVEGDAIISQQLLMEKFDHIFFTGGTKIGQLVMEAAAKNLTPVTLELGGKSPCIVDTEIDLEETAKRIAWGKFLNAGQTCIAPDYLLVEKSIKESLITKLQECIVNFYSTNPQTSPDYCRIVNDHQFNRLKALLKDGDILTGGQTDLAEKYIAPTLMTNVSLESELMQEEIFGPILPILDYANLEDAIAFINQRPKPLALYLFSNNKLKQERVLEATSSGGVCINDTLFQIGVIDLPFGGVGPSGMGAYHGKATFDTFSHYKSVLKKSFRFELNVRYPPYGNKLNWIKRLLG